MYAQTNPVLTSRPVLPHTEYWFDTPLKPQEFQLHSHASLFMEGDEAEFVYEVLEGALCCYRLLADGRRQVLSFSFRGDLIGLTQGDTHSYSSDTLCFTRVKSIPRSALLKTATERPELGQKLLQFATSRLAVMQEHSVMLGRKSALEKVATFLLDLARNDSGCDASTAIVDLPMTRVDIADYLGLTLETVSRTLTKLKLAGVIDLPHAQKVKLRNMLQLESLAESGGDTA